MFFNLYQHTVRNENKITALKPNFKWMLEQRVHIETVFDFAKKQNLSKGPSKTLAVNGKKFKLLGYTNFSPSFDSKSDYSEKFRTWVAANDI